MTLRNYSVLDLTASVLLVILSFAASASRAGDLKTLILGDSIKLRDAKAYQYDKAMQGQAHEDVRFELSGAAEIRSGQVQLTGYLINSSVSKRSVYLAGKETVLSLTVQPNNSVQLRKDAPKPPSSAMTILDIPAATRVEIVGHLDLSQMQYAGSPTANIKWTFNFWTAPKPSGEVSVQLPTLSQAEIAKLRVEITRFDAATSKTAKIVASLKNISADPQIFCTGNRVNFIWQLFNAEEKELGHKREIMAKLKVSPLTESQCHVIEPEQSVELDTANLRGDEFQGGLVTYQMLAHGSYALHFQAFNSAVSASADDAKFIADLRKSHHAGPITPMIETTTPFVVP